MGTGVGTGEIRVRMGRCKRELGERIRDGRLGDEEAVGREVR